MEIPPLRFDKIHSKLYANHHGLIGIEGKLMPIILDFDNAIFKWQYHHSEKMTYAELARRADISLPTLYRMKSGEIFQPDLRKINRICKVLECEPADIFKLERTKEDTLEEVRNRQTQRSRLLKQVKQAGSD
jgi:DNA-binding Xre family transcriptional regulator